MSGSESESSDVKQSKRNKRSSGRKTKGQVKPVRQSKYQLATVETHNQLLLSFRQIYYEVKTTIPDATNIPTSDLFKRSRNILIEHDKFLKLYEYFIYIVSVQTHTVVC